MKSIASRQNPIFKQLREAVRGHTDEIVIEGPKAILDAFAAGWEPVTIVSRHQPSGLHPREVVLAADLFDSLASTTTPQQVLGLFVRPDASFAELVARARGQRIIVALDGVQDPGNVGTIVRLAAAFDAAGVAVLPGCADPYGPKAVRASAGSILNVAVVSATVDELVASGFPLFATDTAGAVEPPPSRDAILVFGSEGRGISRDVASHSKSLRVAMTADVESLNVAASAAILLWQSYTTRSA